MSELPPSNSLLVAVDHILKVAVNHSTQADYLAVHREAFGELRNAYMTALGAAHEPQPAASKEKTYLEVFKRDDAEKPWGLRVADERGPVIELLYSAAPIEVRQYGDAHEPKARHPMLEVLDICDAYESGMGKGLQASTFENPYDPVNDPHAYRAYGHGYDEGVKRRASQPPANEPLTALPPAKQGRQGLGEIPAPVQSGESREAGEAAGGSAAQPQVAPHLREPPHCSTCACGLQVCDVCEATEGRHHSDCILVSPRPGQPPGENPFAAAHGQILEAGGGKTPKLTVLFPTIGEMHEASRFVERAMRTRPTKCEGQS